MIATDVCYPAGSPVPYKCAGICKNLLEYSTETCFLIKEVKDRSTLPRSNKLQAEQMKGIKHSKTRQLESLESKFRSGLVGAGISYSDETLTKCASWVLDSFDSKLLIKSSSSAANQAKTLAYHEFLTTYFFSRDQMAALNGGGILIGPSTVACSQYMPADCKFVGKRLPAVRVRVQFGKGVGLEAGQQFSDGELIGLYEGTFVRDAEDLPSSRMVLKLTGNTYGYWGYCFGEENFERCRSIPALFSYANSPGQGEVVNCRVERTEECRYTVGGKDRVSIPVYALGHVLAGTPLYWDYSSTAGPGMCI